ncbi:hypothetical protein R69919_00769 [Paraburkholderia gardini]|nr:hypothetical protein R69919_00769 [Paraburkholderia gardini]
MLICCNVVEFFEPFHRVAKLDVVMLGNDLDKFGIARAVDDEIGVFATRLLRQCRTPLALNTRRFRRLLCRNALLFGKNPVCFGLGDARGFGFSGLLCLSRNAFLLCFGCVNGRLLAVHLGLSLSQLCCCNAVGLFSRGLCLTVGGFPLFPRESIGFGLFVAGLFSLALQLGGKIGKPFRFDSVRFGHSFAFNAICLSVTGGFGDGLFDGLLGRLHLAELLDGVIALDLALTSEFHIGRKVDYGFRQDIGNLSDFVGRHADHLCRPVAHGVDLLTDRGDTLLLGSELGGFLPGDFGVVIVADRKQPILFRFDDRNTPRHFSNHRLLERVGILAGSFAGLVHVDACVAQFHRRRVALRAASRILDVRYVCVLLRQGDQLLFALVGTKRNCSALDHG